MNNIKENNTFKKLILLIAIFLIGFISFFTLNQIFAGIINKLDKQTDNLKAQITIGEFIAHDIVKTRSLFNELVTTTSSQRSRALIEREIENIVDSITNSLDVLENGGTLTREIALNIAGHLNTTKTVAFEKDSAKSFSMEVIDIKPKLNDLKLMLQDVEKMLEKRALYQKSGDMKRYQSSVRELRRYYKALPAFFNRMTENIRRLLYESEVELQQLEQQITEDKLNYLQLKVGLIVVIISIVLFLGFTIAKNINRSSKELSNLNNNLETLVNEKTKALSELNENLEQRIVIESQKVTEQEKLMMEQSKLASMGEMIGNIAHQWRQPLSVITSSISGIQLHAKLGLEITNKEINETSDLIVQQAKYLSHTIDHFRDFIKGDTAFGPITIKDTLNNTLNLVDATLKSHHIQLIQSIEDDMTINGNINELTEALINIINNAKDAVKENIENHNERYLFVSSKKIDDDTIEVQIKDNGGGIDEKIINRIFEPYFTSKHQSVGTGLGLSMVDKIIRERHKGILKVKNVTVDLEGKLYQGACIYITFNKRKEV